MKTRKNIRLKNKKTKKIKNFLLNTRNEKCSKNNYTSCCPHNKLTNNKYAATNEKSVLHYNKHEYELYTCCMMCSAAMNKMAKNDPSKFKKLYIKSINKNGDLLLKNIHSNKFVQIAKKLLN